MLLEDVICSYQRDKREQLKKREVAKFQFPDEVSTEVNSYDDFILKLGLLCTTLQSKEDLYEGFGKYGVAFDYDTKAAIENYLLKLNLLERKSDSGEAQYVKIVL